MTDEAYEMLFKPVMRKVMEIYQPEAIVFQSGRASHFLCCELWNAPPFSACTRLSDVLDTFTVMATLMQELTHWQAIDWEPLICP